jgi:hypothetical protein
MSAERHAHLRWPSCGTSWPCQSSYVGVLFTCLFARLQVDTSAADATHLKAEYDKLLADSTEQKAQVGPGWCAAALSLCCTYPTLDLCLHGVVLLEGVGVCSY